MPHYVIVKNEHMTFVDSEHPTEEAALERKAAYKKTKAEAVVSEQESMSWWEYQPSKPVFIRKDEKSKKKGKRRRNDSTES